MVGADPPAESRATKAITEALLTVEHTTPEATFLIFEDVLKENWAQNGILASNVE